MYKLCLVSSFKWKDHILTNCNIRSLTRAAKADNENETEATCGPNYCIALTGEVRTIIQILIKPCAFKMAKCMLDEQAKKKFEIFSCGMILSLHPRSSS
jgi:hypothetical protein